VTQNEGFLTDRPGVDGGAFDIDYGNTGNSVIENYGHDTQGYCVAVFGAGFVTRGSIVRGNLCINNGRSPRMADFQGAIFLHTWNGGSIDGLTVEKNTIYWSPDESAPALINDADIRGGSASFRDNVIESTSAWLVDSKTSLSASRNQYRYFGDGESRWRFGEKSSEDLAAVQRVGQESGSRVSSRALAEWVRSSIPPTAMRRFDGDSIFGGNWSSLTGAPHAWAADRRWHLYAELPGALDSDGLLADDAMRQLVMVRSLAAQYRASGLELTLLFTAPGGGLRNLIDDLNLKGMDIAVTKQSPVAYRLKTIVVTPGGDIARERRGFVGPVSLGIPAGQLFGEPIFSQMGAGQ
jgi:hypothetical protein